MWDHKPWRGEAKSDIVRVYGWQPVEIHHPTDFYHVPPDVYNLRYIQILVQHMLEDDWYTKMLNS